VAIDIIHYITNPASADCNYSNGEKGGFGGGSTSVTLFCSIT
jgi:hypothetical protein